MISLLSANFTNKIKGKAKSHFEKSITRRMMKILKKSPTASAKKFGKI